MPVWTDPYWTERGRTDVHTSSRGTGTAQALHMTQAQTRAAAKRRKRLDELGGFGFVPPKEKT